MTQASSYEEAFLLRYLVFQEKSVPAGQPLREEDNYELRPGIEM
jgi:hypothetical protein